MTCASAGLTLPVLEVPVVKLLVAGRLNVGVKEA
jgi:hypothetical protein